MGNWVVWAGIIGALVSLGLGLASFLLAEGDARRAMRSGLQWWEVSIVAAGVFLAVGLLIREGSVQKVARTQLATVALVTAGSIVALRQLGLARIAHFQARADRLSDRLFQAMQCLQSEDRDVVTGGVRQIYQIAAMRKEHDPLIDDGTAWTAEVVLHQIAELSPPDGNERRRAVRDSAVAVLPPRDAERHLETRQELAARLVAQLSTLQRQNQFRPMLRRWLDAHRQRHRSSPGRDRRTTDQGPPPVDDR